MTVREFIEENKGKYTEIVESAIELLDGYMDMDVEPLDKIEMNGCEFYLWLMNTNDEKWTEWKSMDEDEKKNIRGKAKEMDYEEKDIFLVLRKI